MRRLRIEATLCVGVCDLPAARRQINTTVYVAMLFIMVIDFKRKSGLYLNLLVVF